MNVRGRRFVRSSALVALLMVASIFAVVPAAQADPARKALGYAFGVQETSDGTGQPLPEVQAAVSESTSSSDTARDTDTAVNLLDSVKVSQVEADACLDPANQDNGTYGTLANETARARDLAANPGSEETPPAALREVSVPNGFPDENRCVTPTGSGTVPPNDGNADQQCSNYDASAEQPTSTCLAPAELYNARGYAKTLDVFGESDLESEALARCVGGAGGTVEFATGARFSPLSGSLQANPEQPNQNLDPLALGLVQSATVTFWETNWDPRNDTTTDGSDTVWVNALHITTSSGQDIIIGHSEATAECQLLPDEAPPPLGPEPPPGGYPRELTLAPSKRTIRYSNPLTLSGSLDPATEFETPQSCVENVDVTIRRDVMGGQDQFEDITTVRTDDEGNYTYSIKNIDRNAQYIAVVSKDNPIDCAQETSAAKPVRVKAAVSLKVSRRIVRRGRKVRFSTEVKPCDADMVGTKVQLRREFRSRSVKLKSKSINEDCRARFVKRARWRTAVFDAVWTKQTPDHQNGRANPKVVRTKRRRR